VRRCVEIKLIVEKRAVSDAANLVVASDVSHESCPTTMLRGSFILAAKDQSVSYWVYEKRIAVREVLRHVVEDGRLICRQPM